ncbi:unnamed protein product [Meganyctiphanes norvegica]|uniref:Uncharacterized protein n=1 Tax=Meganyctiphanes norvegica TaxID=48144 RepID=A0AAV2PHS9_MEGNR
MLPKFLQVAVTLWLLHKTLGASGYPDLLGVASSAHRPPFLHRGDSHRVKPRRKYPPPIVTKIPRRPPPQYHQLNPVQPHQRPAASGQSLYHTNHPSHQAPPIYNEELKEYSFGYKVKDHYEQIEHGHQEKSDGKTVVGTYNVDLPDGRRQTVDYQADHHSGYLANVQYEGEAQYPEPGYYNPGVTFKPHINPEHHIPEYQNQDVAQDHLYPSYHISPVHQETSGRYYKRSTPPPPIELQRYEYKQPQPAPPPPPPPPATYQQASPASYHLAPPATNQQPLPLQNQYASEPGYEPAPPLYYQPPPPPPSQARQDAYEPAPYAPLEDPDSQYWEQQQQQQYLQQPQQQGQYSQYHPDYAYPKPEPEPEPYNYGW